MLPTVNAPNANAERPISSLFKRFSGRVATLLLICLLVHIAHATSVAQDATPKPTPAAAQSDAQKAFEKLKTLAGSWQGTVMGISINITIGVASSGNAVMHEATAGGGRPPDHEITMFYLEGDRLLATHYCDAGNRARLEGKMSPDGKTVEFTFLDVTGSTKGGLVKRLAFTMTDADHHVIELTFIMPNGKPVEVRGGFQRTGPA